MTQSTKVGRAPADGRALRHLSPRQIWAGITSGLLASVLCLALSISLAALIFSGPLTPFVANGIGMVLVSTVALNIAMALLSPRPPMITMTQDAPVVIVALLAAQIAAATPTVDRSTYLTVVAAIALTTLATGAIFVLLGTFRLGSLVRYMPYPVVGGFLAGTGWLLTLGGISIMTGAGLDLRALPTLLDPAMLGRWLPGFLFGCLVLAAMRRGSHPLLLPALLLGGTALFYAGLALAGLPLAEAQRMGLLLGPFPADAAWSPITPASLAEVRWPLVFAQLGGAGAAIAISVIGLLLNVSGMQLARREEIDLNQELRTNGLAQVAGGLVGGPPGFTSLGISSLAHRMGARSAVPNFVVAACLLAVFAVGLDALALVPRAVLGGIVCFLGLGFLTEWLYDAFFQLPRAEYALTVVILVLIALFGILAGVVLGLLIAVGLFVVTYSRINVVKHTLSGATARSRVTRSYAEQRMLRAQGHQLALFQLQGFLFFGTAHDLLERVRAHTLAAGEPPLRFVLLDFRLVPRVDATAMLSFARLLQLAEARGFTLVFTHLAPPIARQVERELLAGEHAALLRVFPTLDHGLEWCENELLRQAPAAAPAPEDLLGLELGPLLDFFEQRSYAPGEHLIRQGDEATDLFFVEDGQVTAQVEGDDGAPTRLESMGRGRMVGELAFFLGQRRTADVVADTPSRVRRITRASLARLRAERPEAAATFYDLVARLLSERVVHLMATVDALQR